MPQHSDITQAKSIVYHPVNFADYLQQTLGVLNYNQDYDQFFQQAKNAISIVEETREAIRQGVIDLNGSDVELSEISYQRLLKVWKGRCYLLIDRNNGISRKFAYDIPKDYQRYDEIIPLPAMQNLIPVGNIEQQVWGIQIRESVSLKYAFESIEWATVISDGKFMYQTSEGAVKKIKRGDMESITKKTYFVSRSYFNNIVDIEKKFFYVNWNPLKINLHRIISHMKLFKKTDYKKDRKSIDGVN